MHWGLRHFQSPHLMGLETGLQCPSFSLLPYLSHLKYLEGIVIYSPLKQSWYCGNSVRMSTGKMHMLLSRTVSLEKRKPPVCVIRQPLEMWIFLPCFPPLERSHQAPCTGNWGTGTLPETSNSIRKLFYIGKTISVKTKSAHVRWWQENSREKKPTGNSAAFLQTLLDSTQTVSMDLLFPPCAGQMSTLLVCELGTWGAVPVCTIYCLLAESLERAWATLLWRMVQIQWGWVLIQPACTAAVAKEAASHGFFP